MSAILVVAEVAEPVEADAASVRTGIHGHSFDASLVKAALAELVGTFVLGVAIIGTAVAVTLAAPGSGVAYGSLAVPLVAGIALALLAASVGPISGSHVNPAVTVALAVSRRFPWSRVPAYVLAQFVGAIGSALLVWWFYGPKARTIAHLATPEPALGVGAGRVFAAEAVATFVLVLVIAAIANEREQASAVASVAIGAALAVAFFISAPLGGAGVNPAGVLAPMIAAGRFSDWWVYLLAPFAGGTIAAALYGLLVDG